MRTQETTAPDPQAGSEAEGIRLAPHSEGGTDGNDTSSQDRDNPMRLGTGPARRAPAASSGSARADKRSDAREFPIDFKPERAGSITMMRWVRQGWDSFEHLQDAQPSLESVTDSSGRLRLGHEPVPDPLIRERVEDFRVGRSENLHDGDLRFFRPVLLWWLAITRGEDPRSLSRLLPLQRFPSLPRTERDKAESSICGSDIEKGRDWRNGNLDMGERLARDFCVCADESVAMRDALLLSCICDLDVPTLLEVGTDPMGKGVGRKQVRILDSVYHDPEWAIEYGARCIASIDALVWIITVIGGKACEQPLAMLAYLLWWAGRPEEGLGAACRALAIDKDCSLADVLVTAIENRVTPEWQNPSRVLDDRSEGGE